ncbi:MAG: hypothetical protein B0A82_11060 [Alkalinema sp. CACIAM 70d]|nr:MAG: hypothetical protein B0A82_11060 [Alkalinema sp. CACIAM 70d]
MATSPNTYRFDFEPWSFWTTATAAEKQDQLDWQAALAAQGQMTFGSQCFISKLAGVFPDSLDMGEGCYIAAHAHVSHTLKMGNHCSINVSAVVRGKVTMGNGVRIGGHTSILGFNHSFKTLDLPIHQQPLTFKGITIGDDVWIGSGVTIVDGVEIGSHSVIGAGAIVTRNIPPYSVAVGNPARVIKNRQKRSPVKQVMGKLKKLKLIWQSS